MRPAAGLASGAAAEREFAARVRFLWTAFAGRAGVTKAMVYYHFHNKAASDREILLRDMFAAVAGRVAEVRAAGGPPEVPAAAFVRAISLPAMSFLLVAQPGSASWPMAAGTSTTRIVGQDGAHPEAPRAFLPARPQCGIFCQAPLLGVQFSIVGPLLLSAVSEPIRERYHSAMPGEPGGCHCP